MPPSALSTWLRKLTPPQTSTHRMKPSTLNAVLAPLLTFFSVIPFRTAIPFFFTSSMAWAGPVNVFPVSAKSGSKARVRRLNSRFRDPLYWYCVIRASSAHSAISSSGFSVRKLFSRKKSTAASASVTPAAFPLLTGTSQTTRPVLPLTAV